MNRKDNQRLVTFISDSKLPVNPRAEDYVLMSYDDTIVRYKLLALLEDNYSLKGKITQNKLESSTVEPMSYR